MRRVAVVGAGISGLTLSFELQRRGFEVVTFEAGPRVGGKLESTWQDGYLCEGGPSTFSDRDGTVRRLSAAAGVAKEVVEAAGDAGGRLVAQGDRLVPVPETRAELLNTGTLPYLDRLRALANWSLPSPDGDESVAAFGRRRFGDAVSERVFYPSIHALYAFDPDQLSLAAFRPDLAHSRGEPLFPPSDDPTPATSGPLFSFNRGVQTLAEALGGRLGPSLHLRVAVAQVRRNTKGYTVATRTSAGTAELSADAVALATPAPATRAIAEGIDSRIAEIVGGIRYVPLALVYLSYPAGAFDRVQRAYGFYVPPSEPTAILGGVFVSWILPSTTPVGRTLVCVRLGGARYGEWASLPESDLVAIARAEVSRLIGADALPHAIRVSRHEQALPVYGLGHLQRIDELDARLADHPGLHLTGAAYRGMSIPDCIKNASLLAERIAARMPAHVTTA